MHADVAYAAQTCKQGHNTGSHSAAIPLLMCICRQQPMDCARRYSWTCICLMVCRSYCNPPLWAAALFKMLPFVQYGGEGAGEGGGAASCLLSATSLQVRGFCMLMTPTRLQRAGFTFKLIASIWRPLKKSKSRLLAILSSELLSKPSPTNTKHGYITAQQASAWDLAEYCTASVTTIDHTQQIEHAAVQDLAIQTFD